MSRRNHDNSKATSEERDDDVVDQREEMTYEEKEPGVSIWRQ